MFRDDLGGNLVGLEREKRIARVNVLARFFVPNGDDAAGNRFTDRGNFDFDTHARLTLCAMKGRGHQAK